MTFAALAFLLACAETVEAPSGPPLADMIVDAPGDTGSGFRDASRAVNGVLGAGDSSGGTDVFSLEDDPGADDYLVLAWSGCRVQNEPGTDFVVFENAFEFPGGNFVEAAVIEVSIDGASWAEFPHDYLAADELVWSGDPALWQGFAGVEPVRLNEDMNPVDPFDAAAAGGDHFDLDQLESAGALAAQIRAEGFVFLRITNASTRENPDTGAPFPHERTGTGPDIDGVYARSCAPR